MSVSATSSALSGIASAQAMFDAAAEAVAATGTGDADPTEPIVATMIASDTEQLDIAVLRTALETERSLVNLFA
jgi:hypothetical protein